ncbi:MAG TPA: antitoxin [Pseudonocardiaceae bacterium]|jgi:hypothetical protein|nr:antitoxin [Pseudonocardiaceae bacterium]
MGLDDLKDKAKQMLGQHPDQADKAVDKGKEFLDEKTGNKYSDQLDSGADKAKQMYQRDDQQQPPQPPQ